MKKYLEKTKYGGPCMTCGRRISAGQPAYYENGRLFCVDCEGETRIENEIRCQICNDLTPRRYMRSMEVDGHYIDACMRCFNIRRCVYALKKAKLWPYVKDGELKEGPQ